jgi:hypothetical protein
MPQLLSTYLKIDPQELSTRGVLDAYLGIDNALFVDPLLLRQCNIQEFTNARSVFDEYFSSVIKLLSVSKSPNDAAWREARRRLTFKEEHGAALGYSNVGGHGRGIGSDLSAKLAETAKEIVVLGIHDPEIFELIPLFEEGFGSDLLSDMAVSVMRKNFLSYSDRITRELNLKPCKEVTVDGQNWQLPLSPDGKRGIVLVPSDVLSLLPVALDPSEIEDVAAINHQVRMAWNAAFASARKKKKKPSKSDIRSILFSSPQNVRDLIRVYKETAASNYDFKSDPSGLFSWDPAGRTIADAHPITLEPREPKNISELRSVVEAIIKQFKKNMEENKLYEVLYDEKGRLKHERFAQRLFYAVADSYCAANNVDLSREPDAGNGPVDFKLSTGYDTRILVEIKKSSNSSLLHGFETQLKAYQQSEGTDESIYLILKVSEAEYSINDVLAVRAKAVKEGKKVPEVYIIDATKKDSASKR